MMPEFGDMVWLAWLGALAVLSGAYWWRARVRRWRCQGCGHSYTTHLDCGGQASPCLEGASLAAALSGSGCACQAYLGRVPAPRLLHPPAPLELPLDAAALDAPITTQKDLNT